MDRANNNAASGRELQHPQSLQQTQVGTRPMSAAWQRTHSMALTAYAGHRCMEQYQSIPLKNSAGTINTQDNSSHAGGVIDMSRNYAGIGRPWSGKFSDAPVPSHSDSQG